MKLILTRHGETDWNRESRTQGTTDTNLNENGKKQAAQFARRLLHVGESVDRIYTSPLRRAVQTAEIIGDVLGTETKEDSRLREFHFGVWEGMVFSTIGENYPDEFDIWARTPSRSRIEGAEPISDLYERCASFIADMRENCGDRTALVVSHTLTTKILLLSALGLEIDLIHSIHMDNMSVSMLELYPDRTVLLCLNDVCHMQRQEEDR
ncbi:MAG: histidine phosphatase family protein [Christensenellales bacterium]|jgi:broad specificity phosphatase PhoE